MPNEDDSNHWKVPYPEGAEIKTYKGACHCGKFAFELDYVLFDVRPPTICNCSFCTTHGTMVVFGSESQNFRWTSGSFEETMTYQWNGKFVNWNFCSECGTTLLWNGMEDRLGVNIRCFDGFDNFAVDKLNLQKFHGATVLPGGPKKTDASAESPLDKENPSLR